MTLHGRVFVSQPTGRTCRVETFADTLETLCYWRRTDVLGVTPAGVQLAKKLREAALQSFAVQYRDVQRASNGESATVSPVCERELSPRHALVDVDVPLAVRQC